MARLRGPDASRSPPQKTRRRGPFLPIYVRDGIDFGKRPAFPYSGARPTGSPWLTGRVVRGKRLLLGSLLHVARGTGVFGVVDGPPAHVCRGAAATPCAPACLTVGSGAGAVVFRLSLSVSAVSSFVPI
jgi:hypothetical protein